jgi:hypothetical protein
MECLKCRKSDNLTVDIINQLEIQYSFFNLVVFYTSLLNENISKISSRGEKRPYPITCIWDPQDFPFNLEFLFRASFVWALTEITMSVLNTR